MEVEVEVVLWVVVRVVGAVGVELELSVGEVDEVVVGGSVELGMELELELELGLGSAEVVVGSVEDVLGGSEEDVLLGSAVVEDSSLLEEEGEVGVEAELEPRSAWEVALLSRLATLSRLAMVSSSSCRASAALMSVGKMPSRNLVERACRASWMEATLMPASTSWRDSRGTRSASLAGCWSAKTVARAIRATKRTWSRLTRSIVRAVGR